MENPENTESNTESGDAATEAAAPEVFLMSQEDIDKAAVGKEFRDGAIVLVEVVAAERVKDKEGKYEVTKAGALKGTPIVNLRLAAFTDPNDVKSKVDSPALWHRQSLPIALAPGLKLDNQAMGIANGNLSAISQGTLNRVQRGADKAATASIFNETQQYGLKVWQKPAEVVGKRFWVTVEKTFDEKAQKTYTNPKALRATLFENEKASTADAIFVEQ